MNGLQKYPKRNISRWLFKINHIICFVRCTCTGRINLIILLGYDINYLSIWPRFPIRKASKLSFVCFQHPESKRIQHLPALSELKKCQSLGFKASIGEFFYLRWNIKSRIFHKSIYTLMPCPFTSPKMLWAGPNFLCQTKNLFTYCGSHRHFVLDKKMICIQ